MEQKQPPKQMIIKRTGILFALYSAYNIFVLIRDNKAIGIEGMLISALVALLFGVLAAFSWTADLQNIVVILVRKTAFITAILAIILLKLRMAGKVIMYFDFTKMFTILYGASYFLTVLALVLLVIYYAFILPKLPVYPVASLILPGTALVLFVFSLIIDAVLFFGYGIKLEGNWIRTIIARPLFYLSFISLSVYFMFPPMVVTEEEVKEELDEEGLEELEDGFNEEYDDEEYDDEEYDDGEYDDEEYVDEEYDEEYDDEEYDDEEYDDGEYDDGEYVDEEYVDEEYDEEYDGEEYIDEEYDDEEYDGEEYDDEEYGDEYDDENDSGYSYGDGYYEKIID